MSAFLLFFGEYEKIYVYNYGNKTYMPETFSLNTQHEEPEITKFQEDSAWPIKLDGTLSAEEINQCNEHFVENCKSVNDETGWKLGDFLRADVIPNMDSSWLDPYVRERINFLSLTHPEVTNTMSLSPEIRDYFQMSEWDSVILEESLQRLSELWLDLNQFLAWLQNKIDTDLPFLSPQAKEKICKSIWIKTLMLWDTLANMDLEDFSWQELLNQRWIINSKVQETYNFYTNELFPTLELKNKLDNWETIPAEYTRRKDRQRWAGYMSWVNSAFRELDELMAVEIDENWDFNEWWFETQRLLSTWSYENMLADMWVESSENISMLSEEDQKTESIASLWEMCLVWISCLPYIWAIPSVLMDANDLMWRQPLAINALKSSEVLDSWYQIENTWLTKLTAWTSLILTPTWMQGFAKAWKLARSASKINNLDMNTINKVVNVITEKLWFWDEIKEKLLSILWFKWSSNSRWINSNFWENRADSDFMTRAESNGNLSDLPNTGRFVVQWNTMQMTQREESFLVRLEWAYEAWETDLNINNLEAENIQVLLWILNKMHLEHWDIPVWQHTSSQIADKLRIARDAGMDRDIYKIAIREGYAWVTDTYAWARNIINSRDASSLSAEDIFTKIWESLPDEIDLFDLEEALWIWDQKLIEFVQSKLGSRIDESAVNKNDILALFKSPLEMTATELFKHIWESTGIDIKRLRPNIMRIKSLMLDNQSNTPELVEAFIDDSKVLKTFQELSNDDFIKLLESISWNNIDSFNRDKIIAWLSAKSQQDIVLDNAEIIETVWSTSSTVKEVSPQNRVAQTSIPAEEISSMSLDEVLTGLSSIDGNDAIRLLEQSNLQVVASQLKNIIENGGNKWFQDWSTVFIITNGRIIETSSSWLSTKIWSDTSEYFSEQWISFLSNADRWSLSWDLLSQAINN